jgi:hypothetical protein
MTVSMKSAPSSAWVCERRKFGRSRQGRAFHPRSLDQVTAFFAGLTLVDPGVRTISVALAANGLDGSDGNLGTRTVGRGTIHPLTVEWIRPAELMVNPRTSKLIEVVDERSRP